LKLNFDMF